MPKTKTVVVDAEAWENVRHAYRLATTQTAWDHPPHAAEIRAALVADYEALTPIAPTLPEGCSRIISEPDTIAIEWSTETRRFEAWISDAGIYCVAWVGKSTNGDTGVCPIPQSAYLLHAWSNR